MSISLSLLSRVDTLHERKLHGVASHFCSLTGDTVLMWICEVQYAIQKCFMDDCMCMLLLAVALNISLIASFDAM